MYLNQARSRSLVGLQVDYVACLALKFFVFFDMIDKTIIDVVFSAIEKVDLESSYTCYICIIYQYALLYDS